MSRVQKAVKKNQLVVDRSKWPKFSKDDRMDLYRKCGDKCFLVVKGNAQGIIANPKKTLKFPVCRVPVRREKCKLSAAGLLAANRRARLTKQYPELVEKTKKMIQQLGTTAVSRQAMKVESVRLKHIPEMPGHYRATLTYSNGIKQTLKEPLSTRTIKRRYSDILSEGQKKKISSN